LGTYPLMIYLHSSENTKF